MRRKRRQRRARDEKRREKRIAEEENRMMGKFPEVDINFHSFHQFPECGVEEVNPITSVKNFSERSSSPVSLSFTEDSLAGPSFAKVNLIHNI